MPLRDPQIPRWLRALVHADFVAAVLLTVLIPLALLVRAALGRREQLPLLLRYWRVSALLMVTVYLLAGRRPHAAAAGIAARLLIARTLDLTQTQRAASLRVQHVLVSVDPLFDRWRMITYAYCLGGAGANLPMLLPAATTVRTAYAEPPTTYARLFHPNLSPAALGRIGDAGLAAYAAGALLLTILRKILN